MMVAAPSAAPGRARTGICGCLVMPLGHDAVVFEHYQALYHSVIAVRDHHRGVGWRKQCRARARERAWARETATLSHRFTLNGSSASRRGSSRKVSVLAPTGLSFDLSTASGKLMRTSMGGLAEFERDLIKERVKPGLASAGPAASGSAGNMASVRRIGRQKRCSPSTEGLSYRQSVAKHTVTDIVKRAGANIALDGYHREPYGRAMPSGYP